MITAQDIREKGFERAKFGGYDMDAVDDFLEEIADSIGVLQKENASLQKEKTEMAKKMKVLVDKINEYRANEEALNLAVLSAQKLAVQIESDARARANAMLADADKKVSQVSKLFNRGLISDNERYNQTISIWQATTDKVSKALADNPAGSFWSRGS